MPCMQREPFRNGIPGLSRDRRTTRRPGISEARSGMK